MSLPVWCAELAADFWSRAGTPPPLPRDLREVIPFAVPLSVVELAGVSVHRVRRWFEHQRLPVPFDEPDRPLRACLVAARGDGFAFVDSLDTAAEQAFSVAHELAHFLRDYLRPRELVRRRLGPGALDVLDGLRPPTRDERLHALVRNVLVRPFTHLLRRDDTGRPLGADERDAEDAADRLAFELLAPADAVGGHGDREALLARLVGAFGLPPGPAARYARVLMPDPAPAGCLARFLIR